MGQQIPNQVPGSISAKLRLAASAGVAAATVGALLVAPASSTLLAYRISAPRPAISMVAGAPRGDTLTGKGEALNARSAKKALASPSHKRRSEAKRAPQAKARTATTPATTSPLVPPASLMPNSLFNSNVQGWSVASDSPQLVDGLVHAYQTDYGSVGVNLNDPIYQVPAGTPYSSLSVTPGCGDFLFATGSRVPVPSFAQGVSNGDSPMELYSPSRNRIWEFWQFHQVSSGHYEACYGGSERLSSFKGVFPTGSGHSATGISYIATDITEADVKSGSIDHAIGLIVPACNVFVYPANRGDCNVDPGEPGEGQWFRFPANLAMPPGLSPFAQMVFKAVQTYGMVIVDQGGAVVLDAEQPSDWAAEGGTGTDPITAAMDGKPAYAVVASLPWSDLQVVTPPQ